MTQQAQDLELFHFGVKGMKWGVRRKDRDGDGQVDGGNSSSSSSPPPSRPLKGSQDYEEARRISRKPVQEMSNKELQRLTQRMQLEQQYSNLTRQNSPQVKQGKSEAEQILNAFNTANKAIAMWNSPAGKLGRKLVKAAWDNQRRKRIPAISA